MSDAPNPKPLMAAVEDVAVGAGLELALAADLRIASTGARFGSVYVNIGCCPDGGASFLLPRLVGPAGPPSSSSRDGSSAPGRPTISALSPGPSTPTCTHPRS